MLTLTTEIAESTNWDIAITINALNVYYNEDDDGFVNNSSSLAVGFARLTGEINGESVTVFVPWRAEDGLRGSGGLSLAAMLDWQVEGTLGHGCETEDSLQRALDQACKNCRMPEASDWYGDWVAVAKILERQAVPAVRAALPKLG